MAVKLHKPGGLKLFGDPSKQVQEALAAQGIEYEVVKSSSEELIAHTHQDKFPAIELEDGTWYWEEPGDMAKRIGKGELEMAAHEPVPESEWEPPAEQTLEEQMALKEQMEAEATKLQNSRGSEQWQG
jgi:hypothetical protein